MRLSIGLMLAVFALTAHAEVYKWVDANGRVFYSDQPPPANAGKAKKINVKETAVTSVASPKKTAEASKAASQAASATPAPTVKPPIDEAACNAALERLNFLLGAKLFKEVNEKGEVEFLEANKKSQEIADKKAYLEKNCR
ncbi:DUF4124 domain-containing protein [Chitinibacter sp. S2-10]|uniref:DUF4124 domain-containing protein n=1 Tax=Chitinibacter sp. S2-10 TaxID=3373597 RepID=UPI0039779BB3